EAAIAKAIELQPVSAAAPEKLGRDLGEFIWTRATTMFEELSFKGDEIRAVRLGAFENLPKTVQRLAAIRTLRREPEFESIAASLKRAANILKQSKGIVQGIIPERSLLKEP